ncbi:response regulator [Cohnella hongkongensis]|uniref:Response regulator n=1 Tax=Cohnella hongkongensis TaxID=178337 RepID=A0ABV9F944_9BACL
MSIRILLVDDEAVDLEWMRRRVAGSPLDLQIVGAVNTGFMALKVLEQEQADIILSDIRMPILSGIDFARRAKKLQPNVKIVFVSGHEDFGYAKEAIEIAASGYLLKPVEDRELYELLGSVCGQIEQEREQSRSVLQALSLVNEELLLRWLNGADGGPLVRSLLAPLCETGVAVAMIEIDDLELNLQGNSEDEIRQRIGRVAERLRRFASDRQAGMLLPDPRGRFVLLTAASEELGESLLQELIREVREKLPFTVTVGAGAFAQNEEELLASYRQAKAALSAKWLLGKNRLIRGVSEASARGKLAVSFGDTVDRLLEAILQYDLVAIDDALLELFDDSAPTAKGEAYDLIVRITSRLHAGLAAMNEDLYELLKWESHQPMRLFQFETIHDILSWIRRRLFELSELLYSRKQRQKRKLIEEIMRYVEERLDQKITLKETAAYFDFTPNYLGHLFLEETGVHFSQYLNERKMRRVCELLSDPTLKIYEIADRSGYKNILYFNRQFKQATGMTPGEYRKKHKI